MRKSFVVLVVSAVLTIAAVAAPGNGKQPGSEPISVGEFAVMISEAIGTPETSPEKAVARLQARGLNTPLDLRATLTESQVIAIFHDLGVANVQTRNPKGEVTTDRAEAILGGVNLSALAASPIPAADLPTQCLQQRNRGQCNTCCQVTFGCDLKSSCEYARTCAKFCQAVLPPGQQSPTEPEP